MKEPFWIPRGQTPKTADTIIYDADHQAQGATHSEAWFVAHYDRHPAEQMPAWAERESRNGSQVNL